MAEDGCQPDLRAKAAIRAGGLVERIALRTEPHFIPLYILVHTLERGGTPLTAQSQDRRDVRPVH